MALFTLPFPLLADHEPPYYSFDAKKRNYHSQYVVELPASVSSKPWIKEGSSDLVIQKKLDDVLFGEPKVGLAAIAIDKGKIVYEQYVTNDADNLYPSWSMAKSIASVVFGYAFCEGKIASLDDRGDKYSAQLKGTPWGEARIRDLLMMASGASRNRRNGPNDGDYAIRGSTIGVLIPRNKYTSREAFKEFSELAGRHTPGTIFEYKNLDTEALRAVLEDATGERFEDIFVRTIWRNIQSEHRAVWYQDSNRDTIVHSMFFASMRDYARILQHVIDIYKGRTGSACLKDYVTKAVNPQITTRGSRPSVLQWYGYQFWVPELRHGPIAAMVGHQGQFAIFNYETEKIIVVTAYSDRIFEKYRRDDTFYPWLKIK